jgi:hypothetical protein
MEDILYDYHIAQAMASEDGWDTLDTDYKQTLYFAAVLEKHGVSKAEFDSSLTYYYIRADRFSDMYKHVAERLSKEALTLGASEGEVAHYSKLVAGTDTADVWTGQLTYVLVPYPPYNRCDFEQKADTSFRKGDSFLFMLNTEFICQSGSRDVEACITMRYDNDTVVSRAFNISSSGINQIRIPEIDGHKVKDIKGYIYMEPVKEPTTSLKLVSIRNIQLVKFRKQVTVTEKDPTAAEPAKSPSTEPTKSNSTESAKETSAEPNKETTTELINPTSAKQLQKPIKSRTAEPIKSMAGEQIKPIEKLKTKEL